MDSLDDPAESTVSIKIYKRIKKVVAYYTAAYLAHHNFGSVPAAIFWNLLGLVRKQYHYSSRD